jgi:3-hydroxyacyl-CoA dehydrogenase / enoyl-CoA hydratase / 3-hydroxybutyryl-CoA epimerase
MREGGGGGGLALTWELVDSIAVVTLDLKGEPVNKLSRSVKDEFLVTFGALERDGAVQAVAFLSGKPDTFIAGADIEEFVKLSTAAEAERLSADGQDLLERAARFPKPIAVGIHGACLGGGLEFALACHYRVASAHPKTRLGLPEVQLGVLPAAGGCQRLPRLIGLRAALDIILAGKTERAEKAFRLGIVDELVHPAILRDVTLAAAKRMAGGWRPRRRRPGGFVGWLLDGNPLGRSLVFRMARKQVVKQTRGQYPAPLAALEAVAHGLKHGVAKGLQREAQLFGQLAVTDVSRKLVQIFFATTQLKKDFGVANGPPAPPVEVRRLGIVGAGFMGSGIAGTAVAEADVDVRMKDADLPRVHKGLLAARAILDDRLKRRRITKYEHGRLVALLSGSDAYAGFGRADLVIEAVFEDLAVKQQVLREVEAATPDRVVFASNTSTIPIAKIAAAGKRPDQVVGMHFFSPVSRMPLLEVIPWEGTAPGVTSTAVAFGRRMGKTVVVVKDCPGFWINRILTPYMNEAGRLLQEGVAIDEIDQLMVQFGFPVGPITLLDEVGMDVAEKVAGVMHEAFGDRFAPASAFAGMVKDGRLGRKAGKGFYKYSGGKKGGVDPAVYELIGTHPNGGPRPAEVIQRLVLVMLNEAARATGDGIVRSPRDGDIAAIFGFGFPPFRGGPLHHADDLGATRIVGELERLAERLGPRFEPCEVLREQAARGGKFYSDT